MTPAGIEPATFRFVAQNLKTVPPRCVTHCPISIAVFHVNVFPRVILNTILKKCLISYTGCKFNGNIFFFDLIRILRDNDSSLYLRADYQVVLYEKNISWYKLKSDLEMLVCRSLIHKWWVLKVERFGLLKILLFLLTHKTPTRVGWGGGGWAERPAFELKLI